MCNLNLLIKAEIGKNKEDYTGFMSVVTSVSYNSNGDGDGVYFEGTNNIKRSGYKINLLNFGRDINKSHFILSHQRLATHGLTEEYTQPFYNKRFIFGHNGILGGFVVGEKSDSHGVFEKFKEKFEKEKDISQAIKDIFKEEVSGSYSIFIYDKKEKDLYYFKNEKTNIHFFRNKEKSILFITTRENNGDFLRTFFNEKFKEIETEDNRIYKIKVKGKKCLIETLGKIELTEKAKEEKKEEEKSYFLTDKNNPLDLTYIGGESMGKSVV